MHIDFIENGGFMNGVGVSDQRLREQNVFNQIIDEESESGTRNSTMQDENYQTFGHNTPLRNNKNNDDL